MKKIILSTLAFSTLVLADQDPNQLVTHTELGYIETSGNTQTQTFNVAAKVNKNFDKHELGLLFNAQYATDNTKIGNDKEIKNKYDSELNYDYALTEKFSLGYLVGYKYDKFSNFDYQAYTGPAVKYKIISTDDHNLKVAANILYAQDDLRVTPNEVNNYSAYRASGSYEWKILPNLKFNQDVGYRASFEDSENYFANAKSSLTNKISDIFSAGLSYQIDYVNLPGTKEYSDTTFTANIIIDY